MSNRVVMSEQNGRPSVDQIAEASAWVATLHGDNRTEETERAFARWMRDDPGNAQAFEQITELWEVTRNLPRRAVRRPSGRRDRTRRLFATAASAILATALVAAAFFTLRNPSISTDVGELRILALEDDTQITLNTRTRIQYRYDHEHRHVDLHEGEALFEIAKDPSRPFTVTVSGHTITALGTSFVVRSDARQFAVTLLNGSVSVMEEGASRQPPVAGRNEASGADQILTPGERLTLARAATPRIDWPELENVLAWRQREVKLNETPLPEALAEMNRYSKRRLTVAVPGAAEILVTGLFRAGDSLSFARAVADAYDLRVSEVGGEIRLQDHD